MDVDAIIEMGDMAAVHIMQHRDRASWKGIGQTLSVIRTEGHRIGETNDIQSDRYRKAKRALMAKAPNLAALERRDPAGCHYAVWLYENWPEVEQWLNRLPPHESIRLNHPSTIYFRKNPPERGRPEEMDLATLKRRYPELMEEYREEVLRGMRKAPVDLAELGLM